MPKSSDGSNRNLKSVPLRYEHLFASMAYPSHSESNEHYEEHQEVFSYLDAKGSNHKNYRHYATGERVNRIVNDSAIYLTDGSNWNDKFDRERFNPSFSGWKRFCTCFSTSTEESIAMWMLYGGNDGNGAMINFDKATLRRAMSKDECECGRFDYNGEFICEEVIAGERIQFQLVDVLYFSQHKDGFIVKRENGDDQQVMLSQEALRGINEVVKHDSWSHEKEARLVAKISLPTLGSNPSHIKCIRIPLEFIPDLYQRVSTILQFQMAQVHI